MGHFSIVSHRNNDDALMVTVTAHQAFPRPIYQVQLAHGMTNYYGRQISAGEHRFFRRVSRNHKFQTNNVGWNLQTVPKSIFHTWNPAFLGRGYRMYRVHIEFHVIAIILKMKRKQWNKFIHKFQQTYIFINCNEISQTLWKMWAVINHERFLGKPSWRNG